MARLLGAITLPIQGSGPRWPLTSRLPEGTVDSIAGDCCVLKALTAAKALVSSSPSGLVASIDPLFLGRRVIEETGSLLQRLPLPVPTPKLRTGRRQEGKER